LKGSEALATGGYISQGNVKLLLGQTLSVAGQPTHMWPRQ